jgi:DNA primase
VSWTGRSILDRKLIDELKIPRYKNLAIEQSVINPKEIFFNLDNCNSDSVILVEGPFDVLRMSEDTICSLGTSVTREQELFLANNFKKVFIAFDNEPAAQSKARHLGMNLVSAGLEVEVVNICEDFGKNDPGELTEDEVNQIKKELEFL